MKNINSNQKPMEAASSPGESPLSQEQQRIAQWLENVRFRKKLMGGVSEEDVWKKLEELNRMYEAALKAERVRYDALLEKQKKDLLNAFHKVTKKIQVANTVPGASSDRRNYEKK